MHEVLVNRLGGLSLPRKSVVRLTDRPDMTLDVYRGRKTTIQPTNQLSVGNKSCLSHNFRTTEANLMTFHRKIKHTCNEKVCHAQELGSCAQGHDRVKGQILS